MFNRLFIQFDPHGKSLFLRPLRRFLRKSDTLRLCSFICQPFALRRFLRTLRFKFWRIVLCNEIIIFRLRELTYQIRNELIAHLLLQGHIRQPWVPCPFVRNPGIWNKDRQPSHPRTCLNCTCTWFLADRSSHCNVICRCLRRNARNNAECKEPQPVIQFMFTLLIRWPWLDNHRHWRRIFYNIKIKGFYNGIVTNSIIFSVYRHITWIHTTLTTRQSQQSNHTECANLLYHGGFL